MSIKDFVPFKGEKEVSAKLRELTRKAGTLPVLFALFLNEALKVQVQKLPFGIPNQLKFLIVAFLLAVLYVYDEETKSARAKASEKVKEQLTGEFQTEFDDFKELHQDNDSQ